MIVIYITNEELLVQLTKLAVLMTVEMHRTFTVHQAWRTHSPHCILPETLGGRRRCFPFLQMRKPRIEDAKSFAYSGPFKNQ